MEYLFVANWYKSQVVLLVLYSCLGAMVVVGGGGLLGVIGGGGTRTVEKQVGDKS